MTDIKFFDDVTVELVDSMGSDASIVRAARVSVVGKNDNGTTIPDIKKDAGLVNYLVKNRHGSPFEHTAMTFYVKAPIFVFREHMRHRVGHSYNEMSGRYTILPGEFYVPNEDRNLVQSGSAAHPSFAPGSYEQVKMMQGEAQRVYAEAWRTYERLLDKGIANEMARIVLPVGIMSQMYLTINARSAMSFLSLRTKRESPDATFPSNPQREIEMVAEKIESTFAELFPVTYESFNKNGRVSP